MERQKYPNLLDKEGHPIPPYDVTAHTLTLLLGDLNPKIVKAPYRITKPTFGSSVGDFGPCKEFDKNIALYKSHIPSMDEGWTRYILEGNFDRHCLKFQSIDNDAIRKSDIKSNVFGDSSPVIQYNGRVPASKQFGVIVFPDQSPNSILNGYAKGSMPEEYVGGVGKEGVENLRQFVEAGGTLVFLNRSSDFAIDHFKLPVKDVTRGLARKDFFIPGSILRIELETAHPIAHYIPKESIAWFENSPAFELVQSSGSSPSERDESRTLNAKIIATYPKDPKQILLSGWALGAEKIAGKAALVEFTMGKGKVILFGFRPQYRGQSLATFPLFFNAISQ
jgi:hypothetical protein